MAMPAPPPMQSAQLTMPPLHHTPLRQRESAAFFTPQRQTSLSPITTPTEHTLLSSAIAGAMDMNISDMATSDMNISASSVTMHIQSGTADVPEEIEDSASGRSSQTHEAEVIKIAEEGEDKTPEEEASD